MCRVSHLLPGTPNPAPPLPHTHTHAQGFYEGAQLLDLITWLASGTLESEAPLLAALTSIPWPYKPALVSKAVKAAATAAAASAGVPEPQSPGSFTYWAGFASGHGPGSSSGGAALAAPGAAGASGVLGFTAAQAGVRPAGAVVAPLGLRLPHPRQLMGGDEMQGWRPNGYLRVVAPSLYGEAGEWLHGMVPAASHVGTNAGCPQRGHCCHALL